MGVKNSARLPAIVVLSVLATGAAPRKDDVPVVRVSSGEELARVCAAPLSNVRILLERDIDLVPHTAKERRVRNVMSNSFGFGGTNASLVLTAAP